jgi:predicted nucleic acid-binding protein
MVLPKLPKYVWDASALIATVNTRDLHHSRAYSFYKDNEQAVYLFPSICWFEFQAAQSRLRREGKLAVRELYVLDEKNKVVSIDLDFIKNAGANGLHEKFSDLHGADLIYACCAALEDAALVTFDSHFLNVEGIEVIIPSPAYSR